MPRAFARIRTPIPPIRFPMRGSRLLHRNRRARQ
jgi:hypothetical protein